MNSNGVSSLHITDEQGRAVIDSETAELERRERAYRDGRPGADPRGICNAMIALTLRRGARDNVSVVVVICRARP